MSYMNKVLLLFLVSFPVHAGMYFELGVGVQTNADSAALPEVYLPSPLGKFVFGVEAKGGWTVEYEHISSIPLSEEGKGLNVLWFSKRVYF